MRKEKHREANRAHERVELGEFIVADPEICHGKPTFKGTRIMVWQVLEDVSEGRSWEFICNTRWGGRIPLPAVAEVIRLAKNVLLKPHRQGRPWIQGMKLLLER